MLFTQYSEHRNRSSTGNVVSFKSFVLSEMLFGSLLLGELPYYITYICIMRLWKERKNKLLHQLNTYNKKLISASFLLLKTLLEGDANFCCSKVDPQRPLNTIYKNSSKFDVLQTKDRSRRRRQIQEMSTIGSL